MANDMLARTTVAGQEGVIEYLANSSALQHFEQTALAYLLLQKAGRAVSATQLAADTEGLLEDRFGVSLFTACGTEGWLLCPVQIFSSVVRTAGKTHESSTGAQHATVVAASLCHTCFGTLCFHQRHSPPRQVQGA